MLDDFFHFLQELGVVAWRDTVQGTAIQRAMVPVVQSILRYALKTLFGIERMNALPALLCSDEALMRLVGCNAQQGRHGVCQRGAATRQGVRPAGPMCPETLAQTIVKLNVRDLAVWVNRTIRALAPAGSFGAQVTGMVDATDLETTVHSEGWGQVTRTRTLTDKRGNVHAVEVPIDGWTLIVLIDACTKIPLAAQVAKSHEHETLFLRALMSQAQANWAGYVRLHKVVFDGGFLDGTDRWWLDQQGVIVVVPANANRTVSTPKPRQPRVRA